MSFVSFVVALVLRAVDEENSVRGLGKTMGDRAQCAAALKPGLSQQSFQPAAYWVIHRNLASASKMKGEQRGKEPFL